MVLTSSVMPPVGGDDRNFAPLGGRLRGGGALGGRGGLGGGRVDADALEQPLRVAAAADLLRRREPGQPGRGAGGGVLAGGDGVVAREVERARGQHGAGRARRGWRLAAEQLVDRDGRRYDERDGRAGTRGPEGGTARARHAGAAAPRRIGAGGSASLSRASAASRWASAWAPAWVKTS